MTIENATTPAELDESLPSGTDFLNEGDNHIRLVKAVLKTFAGDMTGKASQTEAQAQSAQSNTTSMTPLRVYQAVTARLASQAEAEAGTDAVKLMTSQRTKQQVDARLATLAQAEGNTDNTQLMTSLRTYQQVTNRIPDQTTAEAGTDTVKVLSVLRGAQLALKVFNDNYTAKVASQVEAEAGAVDNKTMTPLKSRQHGDARYLKLSQTTSFTRTMLDDASASAVRSTLGLGNAAVVNLSNSVSSTSSSVAATSAAVKTAYDRGSSALSVANSKAPDTTQDYKGIGSFMLAAYNRGGAITTIASGSTVSGSYLFPAIMRSTGATNITVGDGPLPGTWRNMGGAASSRSNISPNYYDVSLWVRVS